MRVLGARTSLAVFRWDLIYLAAELAADDRPDVAALAAPVQGAIGQIAVHRASLEAAEDEVIVALAKLHKRDRRRDLLLIALGGVARVVDKAAYASMFGKRSPTETAKLGIDAESAEVKRILGELSALDPAHQIRTAYELPLSTAEQGLLDAKKISDSAVTALALARSGVERFKLSLDQLRLTKHGELLALLKDRGEVEGFFRPVNVTPDNEAEKEATAKPSAPTGGAAPVSPSPAAPGGSSLLPVVVPLPVPAPKG